MLVFRAVVGLKLLIGFSPNPPNMFAKREFREGGTTERWERQRTLCVICSCGRQTARAALFGHPQPPFHWKVLQWGHHAQNGFPMPSSRAAGVHKGRYWVTLVSRCVGHRQTFDRGHKHGFP